MKKLIVFNWKMNPASKKEAEELFREYSGADIVVAPPFIYLDKLISSVSVKDSVGLRFASQDVFWEEKGAYTGEISPDMLKDLGVEYAIIGHSERRQYMGETDEMINKKIKASLSTGLKVILCVGETLEIREKGKEAVENFIKKQLTADLKDALSFKLQASSLVVAYEPIWAIGTGVPCAPKDAYDIIKFIKGILIEKYKIENPKVIYGGSVNSGNIKDFMKFLPRTIPEGFVRGEGIDGALVGGASLKPEEVRNIIKLN